MRLLGLLSLIAMFVSAALLYSASTPIAGAIQFIGANKTEQEIKAAGRRRKAQRAIGFVLLIVSAVMQAITIWRAP